MGAREPIRLRWRRPWAFELQDAKESVPLQYCKGAPMFTGIYHRTTVEWLLDDPRAKRVFAFMRFGFPAPSEHYWMSLLRT